MDRVCLLIPGAFPLTAKILLDAGHSPKLPLHIAYYVKDWVKLRELIYSRNVDYNECVSESTNILYLLISDDRVGESLIEALIDRGADLNFPPEFKSSNSYICALKAWKRDPFSERLTGKIESKLTPEETEKTQAYLAQPRKRRNFRC